MHYGWLVGAATLAWLPSLHLLVRWRGPNPHPLRQGLARGVLVGALFACIFVLVGTSRQYDDLVGHRVALVDYCRMSPHSMLPTGDMALRRVTWGSYDWSLCPHWWRGVAARYVGIILW